MGEVIALLLAAAIGASGAVTAQLVAGRATDRRDGRRFAWEMAEAERRAETDRIQAYAEARRELFGRFLALCTERVRALTSQFSDVAAPARPMTVREMMDEDRNFLIDFSRVEAEVLLLNPELREDLRAIRQCLVEVPMIVEGESGPEAEEDTRRAVFDDYPRIVETLQKAMRESLGLLPPNASD